MPPKPLAFPNAPRNPFAAAVPVVQHGQVKPITLEEIGSFGATAQLKSSAVTDKIAAIAKTSDMDEMGKLLTNTIQTAKGYDPSSLKKKGFLGLFKAKFSDFKMRFDTVDQTMQRLVGELDSRAALFRSRITDLDSLARDNKAAHDALSSEIEVINQRVAWMEQNVPDVDPNDNFSAQARQDWMTVIGLGKKRADDLRRLQILMQQQDAQIGQMKQNSAALAQNFSDLKSTTVPALKSTFTLYVINMEQAKGAEFASAVADTTNAAIQANAKQLGQNTAATHTSLTRSNIDLDTLQANHQAVIDSLNTVERIHGEMKNRLATEAPQLEQLSRDLAARLAK